MTTIQRGYAADINRNATIRTCPRCNALTVAGYDHDKIALLVICDTQPLTTQSELLALLAGRLTYDAEHHGNRVRLEHRHQWRIRQPRRWTVLAAHQCPNQQPPDLSWLPTPAADTVPEECPF